jgi:hypothetical protein
MVLFLFKILNDFSLKYKSSLLASVTSFSELLKYHKELFLTLSAVDSVAVKTEYVGATHCQNL